MGFDDKLELQNTFEALLGLVIPDFLGVIRAGSYCIIYYELVGGCMIKSIDDGDDFDSDYGNAKRIQCKSRSASNFVIRYRHCIPSQTPRF